ncbi:FadE34 [Janibacter sp. HTCC2649]|uniref:acyl-CoA dehydrogenase n=1 Tax=Janibacter sp. HTCC2649 TaxID=313589 RepID=UPI0000670BFC|nr:acyl-CoA dehydrogenase [Janibacter sp. HTCC2649]EAQ00605.1 FadE34 [Janibacter sp. HTCC2649]
MSLNQVGVPDTDDQAALVTAIGGVLARAWNPSGLLDPAKRTLPEQRPAWSALSEVGLPGLPVPEEQGGSGGTWADLAVAGEVLGGTVAATPFIAVAAALGSLMSLPPDGAPDGASVRVAHLVEGISSGAVIPAVAAAGAHSEPLHARGSGAQLVIEGELPAVLGADFDLLLASATTESGTVLVAIEVDPAVDITRLESMDLTSEVSRVVLTGATARVLATGEDAEHALRRGLATAVLALGSELVGVQGHALEAAVAYALERSQFGQPIGSFQGVKHRLADVLAGVELSRATVRHLAGLLDKPAMSAGAISDAAGLVLASVVPASVVAGNAYIQVLGGIGYTWEHEAHLFYRRACAAQGLLGGPAAGKAAISPVVSEPVAPSSALADFAALVDEALPAHRAEHPSDDYASRLVWQQRLHASGWIAPHWPGHFGGRGLGIVDQVEYDRVLGSRRAPVTFAGVLGLNNVAPTLMRFGTPEQQEHLLKIQSTEEIWCQGFSEPGSGSDLASLRTRARIEGDGDDREFVISGQKVWTSEGMEATHCLLLVRTDPEAPAHKGISALLVPLDTPGITRRPITQITGGGGFAEMFFDEVRVPFSALLGPLHEGWMVTMTTLAFERAGVIMMASRLEQEVEDIFTELDGRQLSESARSSLLDRLVDARTLGLLGQRALGTIERKGAPGPEHSVIKLVWSRSAQQIADTRLAVAGPLALAGDAGTGARHGALESRATTIAGGTTEVMKNILAQQVLRLPR